MAISRCPGQDRRYWKSEDVFDAPCPHCAQAMEFWKKEVRRRCPHCGMHVLNPKLDLGCAKWCKFASDCLGMMADDARNEPLCQDLISEMKKALEGSPERVRRALEMLDGAEKALGGQQADPLVVKAAAVLLELGARPAQNASSGGKVGPDSSASPVGAVLTRLGVDAARIDAICRIINACRVGQELDSAEFRIVRDAARRVGLPAEQQS